MWTGCGPLTRLLRLRCSVSEVNQSDGRPAQDLWELGQIFMPKLFNAMNLKLYYIHFFLSSMLKMWAATVVQDVVPVSHPVTLIKVELWLTEAGWMSEYRKTVFCL